MSCPCYYPLNSPYTVGSGHSMIPTWDRGFAALEQRGHSVIAMVPCASVSSQDVFDFLAVADGKVSEGVDVMSIGLVVLPNWAFGSCHGEILATVGAFGMADHRGGFQPKLRVVAHGDTQDSSVAGALQKTDPHDPAALEVVATKLAKRPAVAVARNHQKEPS